jgi:hypothetical protein
MRDPAFDPYQQIVMAPGDSCLPEVTVDSAPFGEATVVRYDPTTVVVEVKATAPGYLVLADSWYPGWEAWAVPVGHSDAGRYAEVLNVDVMFRAVAIEPGDWSYTFQYRLGWNWVGVGISLVAMITLILYTIGVYCDRVKG